jgi:hypothetical protein
MTGLLGLGATLCQRDPELSSQILACTETIGAELGAWEDDFDGRLREQTLDTARRLLGDEAFSTAYRDGKTLSLDDAIGRALAT